MLATSNLISKHFSGAHFGYYDVDEIRKLSVKEIKQLKAFDQLNNPIKGGLYDPALGVQQHDKRTRCVTCGQESFDCIGHTGHIELILPVYNPFLIRQLIKLLKSKCFNCHKLRITRDRKKYYKMKFKLLKLGLLTEMKIFEDLSLLKLKILRAVDSSSKQIRKESGDTNTTKDQSDRSQDQAPQKMQHSQPQAQEDLQRSQALQNLKKQIKDITNLTKVNQNPQLYQRGVISTSQTSYEIKNLTKSFFKDMNKKCPHCKKSSQILRQEGLSKIFLVDRASGTDKPIDLITSKKTINDEGANLDPQKTKGKKQQYLSPMEVVEHTKMLWSQDKDILKYVFGTIYIDSNTLRECKRGYELESLKPQNFFVDVLPVSANRFRPENKMGEQTFLHGHTVAYTRILEINQELRQAITNMQDNKETAKLAASEHVSTQVLKEKSGKELHRIITLEHVFQKWIELQDCVVGLFNSEKAQNKDNRENSGVKQILERKQGLFRMKMMGKRVNFACRSVISPDPLLNTNEVGVPLVLARKLMIPENVNQYNYKQLSELIINGPQRYPGALFYEENGNKTSLEFLAPQQRQAIVRELASGSNKIVWRQLKTGDVMLFNRQPTLHKPSIMGHIARVLKNEQTIRFHYANCKSYNADFDGDEMNLHFLQSMVARSEAYNLALNDQQYISPTNGKPIRELMQDMVIASVFLTLKDTFLTKQQYQQLLYVAIWNLFFQGEIYQEVRRIEIPLPAILKPKERWTGKQLISGIMKIIVQLGGYNPDVGLNMESKAKVGKNELPGFASDDIHVIVRDNELLLGVVDKNQLGSGADYGLVHAFHELYGAKLTGQLLTALGRLFAAYLQMHGFSCGMDDLLVDPAFDKRRLDLIQQNMQQGLKAATVYCGAVTPKLPKDIDLMNRPLYQFNERGLFESQENLPNVHYLKENHKLYRIVENKVLTDKHAEETLDSEYKKAMSKTSSQIVQDTLLGLQKKFPNNLFSCMTITGAKGSNVNHSQVSVQLGQQELEGRRVPVMASGRTLPSFLPYDPNPRAGGYVADRFLTGLRAQEFYFHCMAGREGLIDTAVKTSRSGYLQRCLVKHLENLVIQYDLTVRDSDGSLIQVYYGEDGIDTTKTKYLDKYEFLEKNAQNFKQKYNVGKLSKHLDCKQVPQFLNERDDSSDTILSHFTPGSYIGAISEQISDTLAQYQVNQKTNKKLLKSLTNFRYIHSLAHPGEAVGCIAGQSIGEPSTQMTLNTFHLAGHGEKNVTLGIPRLREILMTATKKQKTPTMSLQFQDKTITRRQAERYSKRLSRLVLLELAKSISVIEYKRLTQDKIILASHMRGNIYEIEIQFEDFEAINYSFGVSHQRISQKITHDLVPLLIKLIDSELRKDSTRMVERQSHLLKKPKSDFSTKKKKAGHDEDEDEEDQDDEENQIDDLSIASEELNISVSNEVEQQAVKTEAKIEEQFTVQQQGKGSKSKVQVIKVEDKQPQLQTNKYIERLEILDQSAKIIMKLPLNSKKILMTNIVKRSLANTIVQEIKGIQNAKPLKNDKEGGCPFYLFTEGVNLEAAKILDFIDPYKIESNDIGAIHTTFGIEAARHSIINEILSVFNAYGVSVDYRHLYLISDYMTFGGTIRAMNRIWMDYNTSPFLKMSFETSTAFLTNICSQRQSDDLSSISSSLVMGKIPKIGSALCDILNYIPEEKSQIEEEE